MFSNKGENLTPRNALPTKQKTAKKHLEALQTVHFLGLKYVTNSMDNGVYR